MVQSQARHWAALGLGVLTLAGATFSLSTRTMAQGAGQPRRDGDVRREGEVRRDGDVRREGEVRRDGDPRREVGPEGRPFPGGGFPAFPPMGPMMGGTQMTATPSTVFVLRGNTLYAFDAATLRLRAQAQIPAPPPPAGGFGGGGLGGFGGGGEGNRF